MKASELINTLDAKKWAETDFENKIAILKEIYKRTSYYIKEFTFISARFKMQNTFTAKNSSALNPYFIALEYQGLLLPILGQLEAMIDIYSGIAKEIEISEDTVKRVNSKEEKYDILVKPHTKLDKILYPQRKDFVRVKGKPKQALKERQYGIIVVFGINDYSSSLEVINALFLENCVVLYNTYHNSSETDTIWEDIFSPLIKYNALVICNINCAKDLIQSEKVDKIYFIGGNKVLKELDRDNALELTAECGGNSPFFIVPPERKWSQKELEHQAMLIVTHAKLNASAVSGRSQSILTSVNWAQKHDFFREIKKAVELYSPSMPYYFPFNSNSMARHNKVYPPAKLIRSLFLEEIMEKKARRKARQTEHKKLLMHTNTISFNSMALNEISIKCKASTKDFLSKAIEFSNKHLDGSLSLSLVIDDESFDKYHQEVTHAIEQSKYGSIAINTLPPLIFINPYLNWGGNEADHTLVHGKGHFGNLFNYSNIEKSLSYCSFISETAFNTKNKEAFVKFSKSSTRYHAQPNISNFNYLQQLATIKEKLFGAD